MTRLLLAFVVLSCVLNAQQMPSWSPITLHQLAIDVQGESRGIAYTNKQAGHFYTETNGEHRTAWQGWTVMAREIMEDYLITLDNEDVRKSDATIARVYPHQLQREYVKHRLRETLTLLDSLDAMVVELEHTKGAFVGVMPLYANGLSMNDYVIDTTDGIVMIAQKNHIQRTPGENYPAWIGMTIIGKADKLQFNQRGRILERNFSPCELALQALENKTTIVFAAGDTKLQTMESVLYVSRNWSHCITERRRRMESIVNNAYIVTNDKRFNKALHWAILSMDGLIMNQLKKGIFAGLPWFNNYWGRDSFISLPGATMVLGHYSTARDILQSFAEWQDTNLSSTNYGRIPNLVTTNSVHYNTADGTPWFTMSLLQYYKYSGDTSFAVRMYPVVKRAVEGTLQYHTDKFYFLTHGDAETWMDAVGPDGPWSPRGNRANDIQALWWNQLNAAMEIAKLIGDDDAFRKWSDIAIALRQNFNRTFVRTETGFIYDHLNSDGTPDTQVRPNQFFAIDLVDDKICQQRIFENITQSLVYEHGIASLSQGDPNFHPYHHYQPYYVQDAAYHQGVVWTWLAGPWIHYATRFGVPDLAYRVTNNMVEQILDRGAVGTLSELLDAAPRSGETLPRLSGTFTQAWSLAEFIRNVYQSYLGVSIDATKSRIILSPNLPKDFLTIQYCVWMGAQQINIDYRKRKERLEVGLSSDSPAHDIQVVVVRPFEYGLPDTFMTVISAKKSTTLWISRNGVRQLGQHPLIPIGTYNGHSHSELRNLKLAVPHVRENLEALRGPSHRVLTNSEIKTEIVGDKILYDVEDPVGDDNGNGAYIYPRTPNLKAGSLDIVRCSILADDKNVKFNLLFNNLSDPGWHPEYGFQLTYVAIAIDKDGVKGSGSTNVGMNSNYLLDERYACESIIYVGGGVRVADKQGKVEAEYMPVMGDEKNPLGNVHRKSIEFTLPTSIIGQPSNAWRYTVLVGSQDDHGGAGIGEFRGVEKVSMEWVGGGKFKAEDSNVYDVIVPQEK